jgi:hypothetical protein
MSRSSSRVSDHVRNSLRLWIWTYLGGGNGPDFEVVGTHEDLIQTLSNISDIPLVKVAWLVRRCSAASIESCVDERAEAFCLLLLGQHGNVVLERVRNPNALVANIRDSLVFEPIGRFGKGFVEDIVEVFVVGEDDVSADVEQL